VAELEVPSVIVSYGLSQAADHCVRPREAQRVCLSSSWSAEDAPFASARANQTVDSIADRLELAADLADRSTWFDATDLPR